MQKKDKKIMRGLKKIDTAKAAPFLVFWSYKIFKATVASTHYQALSIVENVEIYSEECLGRLGGHHTISGDVPAELKRVLREDAM